MNEITENIVKAQQTSSMLASDIMQAFLLANKIERPEGRNCMDNALTAYLSECLDLARKLETKLMNLGS